MPHCLDALARQRYPDREFILVDNNSTDGSADIVRHFLEAHPDLPFTLLREEKQGATAARNRGAAEARGEWLAITDVDCISRPTWLSDLAVVISAEPGLGAFAGCIMPAATENIIAKFLGLYTLPAYGKERIYHQYTLIDGGFPTANLTVRKDVFKQIGGFDESMQIYGEDHDLCMRIYMAGYGIKCLTNAIVQHVHRSTLIGMMKQAYSFGEVHPLMLGRLDSGVILIQGSFLDYRRWGGCGKIWIDLNQADKKMFIALLAGLLWWPLWVLPFAYFCYLNISVLLRSRRLKTNLLPWEVPVTVILLLLKSAVMTSGRLTGSVRSKVICI
ncbi:MAG: glycosyltransferase [Kiritimatiellae bacterium]|nr:glycosyltransferase [Kiritimatiellia bacterium]